jgi:hypothetical protein
MARMRIQEGDNVLGEIEADHIPVTGDTFWWKTAGPFRVTDREWNFPAEYNDVVHRVTVTVERIE